LWVLFYSIYTHALRRADDAYFLGELYTL